MPSADDPGRVRHVIAEGEAQIECIVEGKGPAIVLLPSLARDCDDFEALARALASRGFTVIRPAPRGIGASHGPEGAVTLADLAADVATVLRVFAGGRGIVLGHAFGNWVARNVAVHHPELVRGVVLAAAAARQQPPIARKAVEVASDLSKSDAERLEALRVGFFAPGHDAHAWLSGWHAEARGIQRMAAANSPREGWWHAGGAPILDIIAELDPFRPRETWEENRSEFGARVTVKLIADASHALVPEQPDAVADVILEWAESLAV